MKKILMCIFLIGLFALGWTTLPPDHLKQNTDAAFVHSSDQVKADVIYAADETSVPAPDTPAPIRWIDENLLLTVGSVLGIAYEFLARKIPTSKTLSIFGSVYKLLNYFIPDKSKNGGTLQIRDKL